jgi:hypothetical protein
MDAVKPDPVIDAQMHLKTRGFSFLLTGGAGTGNYFWGPPQAKWSSKDHEAADFLIEQGFTYSGQER